MPCIAVSTLYVLLTMFLAEAIRKVVEAAMPNKSLVKTAILEFVASAEMCGCGFELIIGEQISLKREQRKRCALCCENLIFCEFTQPSVHLISQLCRII